jgi:hypothetical protein
VVDSLKELDPEWPIREVEVHANGFAHIVRSRMMQTERNSAGIKMGVEVCRLLKGADVKLVRIFQRNFGLVGNWLGHGATPSLNLICIR